MDTKLPWGKALAGIALIVVAAVLAFARPDQPTPAPPVPKPTNLDLDAVFVSDDAQLDRESALLFGAICGRIAATFEEDAKRGPDRRIRTGEDVARYRSDLAYYAASGWRFSSSYPLLPNAMKTFLDEQAGNNPGELTAEDVLSWARAFRTIQAAALYAAANR